ncbi:MAG: hypothetical protein RL318_577 [Fibrobacterota bacterium]|jgi:hypothetical protein
MRRGSLTSIALTLIMLPATIVRAESPWSLVKDKEGIQVFRRPHPGSDIQEVKAIGKIRSDLTNLVKILSHVESQTRWIPLCVESKSLAGATTGAKRIYRKYDNPWPFQDIDYVVDQTTSSPGVAGEITLSFQEVKDALPAKDGCGRMREYRGSWKLLPTRDDQVEVTYIVHFVPEGKSPSTFINASLGKIGWDTFKGLQDFATKPLQLPSRP